LKDTQLIKAQNRVKELEKQIEEWRKAGNIPSETTGEPSSASAPLASAPTAGSPTAPVPPPSASAPSPSTSAPPRGAAGATAAPPTRKPSVANVAAGRPAGAAAATAAGQPARGRGRGTVRGHIGIRGAAAPGVGRGTGAPPQGPASGAPAGGVAIMGAASKRTREEGEASTEDSLSKRLKPAAAITPTTSGDGGASTGAAGSTGNPGAKPITLQRNRVQPS